MFKKPSYEELEQKVQDFEALEDLPKDSDMMLQRLFDLSIDMLCVADIRDGCFKYINKSFEKTLGYTKEELLKEPFINFVHSDDRSSTISAVENLSKGEPVINFDNRYRCKDGSYKWLAWTSMPVPSQGLTYAVARDITERKQSEELIHTLTHKLIKSQENERQRISRELHDSVAQDLSVARIDCEMLLDNELEEPSEVKQKISRISETLHTSIIAVRDLSYDLRPPGLNELGLVHTLQQYCEDFSEKAGVVVDFKSAGMNRLRLNFNTKINLYRLVQEGINNVKKHADAHNVSIKLISALPNIILRIEDDGKGFDVMERLTASSDEKRMGLQSMKERVSLLQGRIDIQSSHKKGTNIVIEIPYME
jgi:PAS domain S-box-containing protein